MTTDETRDQSWNAPEGTPQMKSWDVTDEAWEAFDSAPDLCSGIQAAYEAGRRAAGVAPPAPGADRKKLIEEANRVVGQYELFARFQSQIPGGSYSYDLVRRLADALATPAPVHIADEAVQKLRGLGLDDTAIRERLAQATMLAAALVSDELVQVVVKIAAKATLTSEDLHQMERRGVRVMLRRGPNG